MGLFDFFKKSKASDNQIFESLPLNAYPLEKRPFRYEAGELYEEAEALRKAGHFKKAEQKYLVSIKAGEKDDTWINYGPAPAMYEALAKLYYHSDRDNEAIEILDKYILWQSKFRDPITIKSLRERMANGNYRRIKQKGSWD